MDLLNPDDVVLGLSARGKSVVIDALAARLAQRTGVAKDRLLTALAARERLGSTAINQGVAIPHAHLDDLSEPAAAFARLENPLEFGAPDGNPVDLVFAFIWPTRSKDGFLQNLAPMCRLLRQPELLARLRKAKTAEAISLYLGEAGAHPLPPGALDRSLGQLRA